MRKMLISFGLVFLLIGCCDRIKVDNTPLDVGHVTAPKATPLTMLPVKWSVVKNGDNIYYSLDSTNYQNLSLNFEEIARFLQEQKSVIKFWDEYVNKPKNTTKDKSVVDPAKVASNIKY